MRARSAGEAPRVFISYSHDSDKHREDVAAFVGRLRGDGVEVAFDQDEVDEPVRGWLGWCDDQIEGADYVLAVCTPKYRRRFERRDPPATGRGATWEGERLRKTLYDAGGRNFGIVPVMLPGAAADTVPDRLRRTRRYDTAADYDALVALLREPERLVALGSEQPWELPTEVGELVFDGIETLPVEPLPSQLLNPCYGVVPFSREARRQELELLSSWCGGAGVRVRLFHGPGGAGKTRLFREWCAERRNDTWLAGFLPMDTTESDLEALLDDPRPTLLVVDYAESRPVEPLLVAAGLQRKAGRNNPLRIALVARTCGDWWSALSSSTHDRSTLLSHDPPVNLSVLSAGAEVRRGLFEQAHREFADRRGIDASPPPLDLDDERFERILYVHAAALDLVERARRGDQAPQLPSPAKLLKSVLDHEERFWLTRWVLPNVRRGEAERRFRRAARRTVAGLTMRGGVPDATAAQTLLENTDAPACADDTTPHETFAMVLRDIYPGREEHGGSAPEREAEFLAPLEPDLLGEALVAGVLEAEPEGYVQGVFVGASSAEWESGFRMLGRVMQASREPAATVTEQLLSEGLQQRAVPAVRAALAMSRTEVFSGLATKVVSMLTARCPPSLAGSIERALQGRTLSLVKLQVWAYRQLLPEAVGTQRAELLNNLGVRLDELGQREEALGLLAESVAIRREQAQFRSEILLHHLAEGLNNLGGLHRELGRSEEALASTAEAVDIRRELARAKPEVFRPHLALSLNNLGTMQGAHGHELDALASTAEAVAIYRELAQQQPDVFLPLLAMGLNGLSNRYSNLGQAQESMAAAEEAVNTYRELARERPDQFLSDLAGSLNNLGMARRDLGQNEAALSSTTEAIAAYRELARERPDAFLPDLARSFAARGSVFSAQGLHQEALDDFAAGLRALRPLFDRQPEASLRLVALLGGGVARACQEGGLAMPEDLAPLFVRRS
ncbi:MAG: tetratricopeptide repeat protein [Deltaproteobacteria bacterium]|nr:tetratricopeptide repeat protein [Deltaproteobacteria bacterium]